MADGAAVPAAFHAAAARWARGTGTASDVAALSAVSLGAPLPPGVDAGAFAFDETTRLPPCAQLAQFVAAKDAARARAHAEIERAARGALVRAVEAPLLPPLSSSGRLGGRAMGTGAAAGAGAAARAATLAHNVVWRVRAEELLPAGPEFVTAMRDAGWDARVGEEDGVFEFEARNLAIGDAVNLYFRALRVKGEALPAGEIANGAPRAGWKAKVAGWICDLGMHIVPIVHVAGTQGKGAVQCFFVFVAVGYVLRWATA